MLGLLQSAKVAIQPCHSWSGVLVARALVVIWVITRCSENLARAVGSVTSSERAGSIVGTGQVTGSSLWSIAGPSIVAQPASAAQSTLCLKNVDMGRGTLQPWCRV